MSSHKGLEKILQKIAEDPGQIKWQERYRALALELSDPVERSQALLQLANTVGLSDPKSALHIAYEAHQLTPDRVPPLKTVAECLSALGHAGMCEVVKNEIRRIQNNESRVTDLSKLMATASLQKSSSPPPPNLDAGKPQLNYAPQESAPRKLPLIVEKPPPPEAAPLQAPDQVNTPAAADPSALPFALNSADPIGSVPQAFDTPNTPNVEPPAPAAALETGDDEEGSFRLSLSWENSSQSSEEVDQAKEPVSIEPVKVQLPVESIEAPAPPLPPNVEPVVADDKPASTGIDLAFDFDDLFAMGKRLDAARILRDAAAEFHQQSWWVERLDRLAELPKHLTPQVSSQENTNLGPQFPEENNPDFNDAAAGGDQFAKPPAQPPKITDRKPMAWKDMLGHIYRDLAEFSSHFDAGKLLPKPRLDTRNRLPKEALEQMKIYAEKNPHSSTQDLLLGLWGQRPGPECQAVLEATELHRRSPVLWGLYLDCLLASGNLRKAHVEILYAMESRNGADWLNAAWARIPPVFAGIGWKPIDWEPSQGIDKLREQLFRQRPLNYSLNLVI